jgi:hypothetical protein
MLLSFFTHLSTAATPSVAARTSAGIAALELYDSVRSGRFDPAQHAATLERVRADVAALPVESATRIALDALLDALPFWETPPSGPSGRVGRRAVLSSLLLYGRALAGEAEWHLARDAYALTAVDAEVNGELEIAAQARLRLGLAARFVVDWTASAAAYTRAKELAEAAGDFSTLVRALIGEANTSWVRGNYPDAERRLRVARRRAKDLCPEVMPRVLLAQAGMANGAGNYERALMLAHRALRLSDEDETRYQALVDIANFLVDFGAASVASEALGHVAAHAGQLGVRLQAVLNLLYLAVEQRDREAFDARRAQLDRTELTARQRTQLALFVARGLRTFGELDAARAELVHADELARQHDLFQFTFDVETEAREIDAAAALREQDAANEEAMPQVPTRHPLTRRVRRVARSVRSLVREHAVESALTAPSV